MSDYIADITALRTLDRSSSNTRNAPVKDKTQLDMTDFLTLMIKEMTSQSLDSSMDTSEMLNQLVQMQMVQAMTNMTDASIMSYAASLVGKEVTVAGVDSNGKLEEHVGIVTGTGVMNGKQVVFVDDKYYFLSEIMAVGRLPKEPDPETDPDKPVEGGGTDKPVEGGGTDKPVEGGGTDKPEKPSPEKPGPEAPVPPAPEVPEPHVPDAPTVEGAKIPAAFDRPFAVSV